MYARLLFAVALVLGLSAAHKEVSVCLRANARSCGECIRASETCGWCSQESFLSVGEAKSARCDDLQSLLERQCPPENIENPRGSISVLKNLALTDRETDSLEKQITQIQPQKISLSLRSGEAQTFSLRFKRAEDYPIDLYYLMDLSFSMKDDLQNVKNLGTDLMMEMQKITSDFRIGFGSMVRSSDARSCPENQNCSSPFTFKNLQRLSQNRDQVHRELSLQQVSELDSPEGGLHALRQAALCEEQIGWRNGLRFLVVVTKGKFHFVKEGPIQTGLCQLQTDGFNHDGQISSSLSDLADVLARQNIQTFFLVSENHLPVYQELTNNIPKSTVRTLSNSSSVFELITEAYSSLSSEVILENSGLSKGVTISYKSLCKNGVEGTGENGRKCSNISIGDEVSFEISVSSQQCPEHGKPEVVKIKPLGFNEEVEVVLNFICECQCSAQGEPQSNKCFGHGSFQCGACNCDRGWVGSTCECSSDFFAMDANCRKDDGTDICSNNGDCVCGTCECKKRENPNEVYSGAYCECDNFNCDRSNNKLCGGHGRCECRKCICDANYTGSACDCSLDQTSCLAKNGQICNGRGTCECGVCKCTDPKFQGPTCEICPTCPGVCSTHAACVQCLAFGTGQKAQSCEADCSYLTMTKVASVRDLPQPTDQSFPLSHCKERDENDCWFYFTYSLQNGAHRVTAVQKRDCPSVSLWDMALPPNIRRLV